MYNEKENNQLEDNNYSYNNGREASFYGESSEEKKERVTRKPVKRNRGKLGRNVLACASLALVLGTGMTAYHAIGATAAETEASSETEAETQSKAETSSTGSIAQVETLSSTGALAGDATTSTVSQVAENTMPSIVAITSESVQTVQSYFGGNQSYTVQSAGSGIIVGQNEDELLIATNNHVVEGAETMTVCFTVDVEDQETAIVEARTKGTDSEHDLAVIAVNLSDIPDEVKSQIKIATLGDSNAMQLGSQVVAVGNALGIGQSVTVGYVSALNRSITVDSIDMDMIQTDAAINEGNSGGALMNLDGEVIGINSAKAGGNGIEGMGYAIPIDIAKPIIEELMTRTTRTKVDSSEKGFLGITPVDVSNEAKTVYNMPSGVYVYDVVSGSGAETAGLKKGDIITKIDGNTVTSRTEVLSLMNYYKSGETIDVVLQRQSADGYEEQTVSVTLGDVPADSVSSAIETENETEVETDPTSQDSPYGSYDDFWNGMFGFGGGMQ